MSKKYLAFDVGGTTIKYGIVDENLQISDRGKVDTLHNKDGHIWKSLIKVTKEIIQKYQLDGIGVSTAGIVGDDGSIMYAGPTISDYQGTPIKKELERTFKIPVSVVNDVSAALLGEKLAGSVKNASTIYCVALGTGIGGAFWADGHLFNGYHQTGNSIGYTLFDPITSTNYEQRSSTIALQKELEPLGIDPIEAFARAKKGSLREKKIIDAWALQVAEGLSSVLLLLDPEVLVIGGAVSKQGDYLKDLLDEKLNQILPPNLCKTVLKMASLGNDAQLYGGISNIFEN